MLFVQFWAQFPWVLCPCSAYRGFCEGLGLLCTAFSSLLSLRSACYLAVDAYQQHLKRWRKGNAAFRGLAPGTRPRWGRARIALAMLWGVAYSSVQCYRKSLNWEQVFRAFLWSWDLQSLHCVSGWFFGKIRDKNYPTISRNTAKENGKSIPLPLPPLFLLVKPTI